MTTPYPVDALMAEAFGDKYNADPGDPAMAHEWRIFSDGFQASARALAAVPAEPKRQYYYRVTGCQANEPTDADCICWHDEGTGPLAAEPQTIQAWRAPIAQQAGGVPAGYLQKFFAKGGGIVHRFYNCEDQSVVDAGAWMQEAMQLLQALAAAPTPSAVPRVVDKSMLKRLVTQVFGEEFQITRVQPLSEAQIAEQVANWLADHDYLEEASIVRSRHGIVTPKEPGHADQT